MTVYITTSSGTVTTVYPQYVRIYREKDLWTCTLTLPNELAVEMEDHMWTSTWVVTDNDGTFLFAGRLEEPVGVHSDNASLCYVVLRDLQSKLMDQNVNHSYELYTGSVKTVSGTVLTTADADDAFNPDELIGKVLFLQDATALDDYEEVFPDSGTDGYYSPGRDLSGYSETGAFANTQDDDDGDLGWRIEYDGKEDRIDSSATIDPAQIFLYMDFAFDVSGITGRADSEKFYIQGKIKSRTAPTGKEGEYAQMAPVRIYIKRKGTNDYEQFYANDTSTDYRSFTSGESNLNLENYVEDDGFIYMRVKSGFLANKLVGSWFSLWGFELIDWYLDLEVESIKLQIPYKTKNVSTDQYVITDNAEHTITVAENLETIGWATGDWWSVGEKNSTIVAELVSKYMDIAATIDDTGYGSARLYYMEFPRDVLEEFAELDNTHSFKQMDVDKGVEHYYYVEDFLTAVELDGSIISIGRYDRQPNEYGGCQIFGAYVENPETEEFEQIISDVKWADGATSPKVLPLSNPSIRTKPDADRAAQNKANRFSELVYGIDVSLVDTPAMRALQPGSYASFPGSYVGTTGTITQHVNMVEINIDYTQSSQGEATIVAYLGYGHSSPEKHKLYRLKKLEESIRRTRAQALTSRIFGSGATLHDQLGGVTANQHHNQKHDLDSTSDHNGVTGTEDNLVSLNASKLPKDSGIASSAITTNASNISTNTSNISTNTSNISTNTSNISTNATNISTNTSNISTNTTKISGATQTEIGYLSGASSNLQDQINAISPFPGVGCYCYKDSSQNVSSGSATAVQFTSSDVEDFDSDSMHDPASNNTRITIPSDGFYEVKAGAQFSTGDSDGNRRISIYVNGTEVASSQTPGGSITARETVSIGLNLAATDYVELYAYQNSGSTLAVSTRLTFLQVVKLGGQIS